MITHTSGDFTPHHIVCSRPEAATYLESTLSVETHRNTLKKRLEVKGGDIFLLLLYHMEPFRISYEGFRKSLGT